MNCDDFDDWEDAVVIGSFFNEMIEEEFEEKRRKRKNYDLSSDTEDADWQDLGDDTEDY